MYWNWQRQVLLQKYSLSIVYYYILTEATIHYIIDELDEREREDFFRLKKVQEKKKIAKDKEERIIAERKKNIGIEDTADAPNIIDDDYDEDLLFTS